MNNLVIDIRNGDTKVSTPVQMWQDDGKLQQKWCFVSESEISSEIFGTPDLAGR